MRRQRACKARPATALRRARVATLALAVAAALAVGLGMLAGCGESGGGGGGGSTVGAGDSAGTTSGPAFERPSLATSPFDADAAVADHDSMIDVSHASLGYVAASAQNQSRLKLLVTKDGVKRNYDLPGDGTPVSVPLTMGDGAYDVQVMQNTEGDRYVPINGTTVDVALASEFELFLRPIYLLI